MRLLRLRVTAFGPFAGTEDVDFERLGDAGLFLIQGPTGAGKTSVLDAVCFALYGRVPGARKAVRLLRSDHAAPQVVPQVVLEFAVASRHLRITRSPAWEKPKVRGTGTRLEQPKVLLEELKGGAWKGVSTGLDEAAHEIEQVLGMNSAQFSQVVMLPQGEFATFLRAGAEERRKVLEKLFATEIYAAVEKWMADERARTNREAEELYREFLTTAGLIAEITGEERPEEDLLAWADGLAVRHEETLAVTTRALAEARERLQAAQRERDAGRELADRRRRYDDAIRRQGDLAARELAVQGWRDLLERADRADRVLPHATAEAARRRRSEQAEREAADRRGRVAALVPPVPLPCGCGSGGPGCACAALTPEAPVEALVRAERVWRGESAKLDGLRGQQALLQKVRSELGELRGREAYWQAEEADQRKRAEELPHAVEAARAEVERARIRAAGADAAAASVTAAQKAVEDARRRDLLSRSLVGAEDEERQAIDRAQRTRDEVQRIREARLNGMAALLAAGLRPGDPCQVCGSTEHPAPARAAARVPAEAEESAAAEADDAAQRHRQDAAVRVRELRTELDLLLEQNDAPVEELRQALLEARAELEAGQAAAARIETLEQRFRATEQDLERAQRSYREATRQLAENGEALTRLTGDESRLRAELDAARGSDATLDARIARLNREADLLTAAIEADERCRTARLELDQAERSLSEAWKAHGFGSAGEAAQALLPPEERARLTAGLQDFSDRKAEVRAALDSPELQAAAQAPVPDLSALEAAARDAEENHTRLASAHDQAVRVGERLAVHRAALHKRHDEWGPAAHEYRLTARLANLVNGQPPNPRQMRLSAYVLSARLEQVVAAANERLSTMSSSRYLLKHTDERSAGDTKRASGGLGLRVIDGWTGQERDPATLSGGESFITSLSLALGLADVVTAEAGGAEIATLFVDEGFGTLDEDTLDEVMTVLDSLRDGGRAVGVVSHVAELRTRIPTQLRLRKTRKGSTLSVEL